MRATAERLADRFGVTIQSHKPSVAYRESICDAVTVRGRHKKQSGGHGRSATLSSRSAQWAGRRLCLHRAGAWRIGAEAVFFFVEAGARDAMARGPLGRGHVAVTLVDGSYHTVDSSDMAFRAAAKLALDEALVKVRPMLLEPIFSVTVYVPTDASRVQARWSAPDADRSLVFSAWVGWAGWEARGALIPEAEIGDLIIELRSVISGVGVFETKFDHLANQSGAGPIWSSLRARRRTHETFVERPFGAFPGIQTRRPSPPGAARLLRGPDDRSYQGSEPFGDGIRRVGIPGTLHRQGAGPRRMARPSGRASTGSGRFPGADRRSRDRSSAGARSPHPRFCPYSADRLQESGEIRVRLGALPAATRTRHPSWTSALTM